jgi:hypothetical protein
MPHPLRAGAGACAFALAFLIILPVFAQDTAEDTPEDGGLLFVEEEGITVVGTEERSRLFHFSLDNLPPRPYTETVHYKGSGV